jgi:hypothetical protein
MFRFWIVLAILGLAALGASLTIVPGYKGALLGIVLGGVLIQAGITIFALHFGRERRSSRRRRYVVG